MPRKKNNLQRGERNELEEGVRAGVGACGGKGEKKKLSDKVNLYHLSDQGGRSSMGPYNSFSHILFL